MPEHASALNIIRDNAEMLRPPKRLTVPESSEQYVYLDTPGGYAGPWRNDLPYYMVEPAECLTEREKEAVIFVGPAQSAKTQMLVDNWAAHTITCDPSDMMVVQTSMDTARDYSKRRIDRMIDASSEIKGRLRPGGHNDNTYDKIFKSGMILTLAWPTKNQLAGKAIGKMALTDYDRMPENIDGEGAAFYLAKKRTTTFLSRAMTMAESSPSKPVLEPKWKPKKGRVHEAPPTKGILGLYNTGDRRRLYSPCPHCKEYFTPSPGIDAVYIPDNEDIKIASSEAGLVCPHCASIIDQEHERQFKRGGVWLREGQTITKSGKIKGEGLVSERATFWLPGWFAAFQTWRQIVAAYLLAKENYVATGDEEALKNTTNLDQGAPYLPKQLENIRDPHELEERAEQIEKRTVPAGVRFLLASVDVQKGRFVVQVEGFGERLESWVVDRFSLRLSYRNDDKGEALPLDPASYLEDWDVLINNVLLKTYETEAGAVVPIHRVACDSGGQEGVTDNAYKFWRKLKKDGYASKNFKRTKFLLVKGGSKQSTAAVREIFPDARKRKDRKSSAAGDVPVYLINTDQFKDSVANALDRKETGATFIHFPNWLTSSFYAELTAEIRTDKGWVNKGNKRNEAFDLMVYCRVTLKLLNADSINWKRPPAWAKEIEKPEETTVVEKAEDSYADKLIKARKKKQINKRKRRGGFTNRW